MPTADYCTRAWDLWGLNPEWFNLSICLWKHVWSFLQIHNKQKKSSRNFHCLALEKKRWNVYKTTILDGKLCPSLCQTWVEYCLLLDSSPLWSCCAVSPRQRSLAAQIWCSLEVSKDDDVETVQKEARILVLPHFHGTNWRERWIWLPVGSKNSLVRILVACFSCPSTFNFKTELAFHPFSPFTNFL